MSLRALLLVIGRGGLPPAQRLALIYLADAHNDATGQCNPSPELLAERTGLSATQVRAALRKLETNGLIRRQVEGWHIEGVEKLGAPEMIPADWWPDEGTIAHLVSSFPAHHFDLQEAVHEFIRYHRAGRILIAPGARNSAFHGNVSALLSRRRPGAVSLAGDPGGDGPPSLGDRLFGAGEGP